MQTPTEDDPLSEYKLIKDLRQGGEGKAILYEKNNGTKYVCKQRVFNTLNEANQGLKEAMSLARIDHPNIVKFEDAVMSMSSDNRVYLSIIMEYCPLGDLLDFLVDLSETSNNQNQHTVTLGSELSSMTLGSDYSLSDIDSNTSRTSSNSSLNNDVHIHHPEPIQHSASAQSLKSPPSSSSTTTHEPLQQQNKRNSLSSLTSPTNNNNSNGNSSNNSNNNSNSTTPRKSSKPTPKSKCSLKERKCIIKMTRDLTKAIFTSSNKKSDSSPPTTVSKSPSKQSILEMDHIIHSNEISAKKDVYLIEQTQLIEWLLDLSYGVQALHKANMIHRDLKSENIFISGSNKLKIGDFGLAIASNHHAGSIHKETVGTYCYSSPELLNSTYDKTTDIFSLGCIFYELITLKLLASNRIYIGEEILKGSFDSMAFLATFPQKYEKLAPLVLSMLSEKISLRPSIDAIISQLLALDTSLLRERIIIKRENTIKGIKKQLEKSQLTEAAMVLASTFVTDPRFSHIFPPSDPTSIPQLQQLFKYMLKVMSNSRCNIWGYFAIDGTMVSVFVWLNPDEKKEVKLSDCIKGSISLVTKIGLKRVGQVIDLLRFDDLVMSSSFSNETSTTTTITTTKTTKNNHQHNQQHWLLAFCGTLGVYKNNGIGHYMMENILNWADHSQMECKTLIFNRNSLEFFQDLGFEISTEIKTNLPKGIKTDSVLILNRKPKYI